MHSEETKMLAIQRLVYVVPQDYYTVDILLQEHLVRSVLYNLLQKYSVMSNHEA